MFGMKKDTKKSEFSGRLPACTLDRELIQRLLAVFNQKGEYIWHAEVGNCEDILGKIEERPKQTVASWEELTQLLQSKQRVDSLSIIIEYEGNKTIVISFKNFTPPSGKLVVKSDDSNWSENIFYDILEIFETTQDKFTNLIYTGIGFGMIQTVIPLTISCIIVMLAAGLLIPVEVRRTQWLWWITAATMVITLRVAYSMSDKLILYVMKKYPYIRFS